MLVLCPMFFLGYLGTSLKVLMDYSKYIVGSNMAQLMAWNLMNLVTAIKQISRFFGYKETWVLVVSDTIWVALITWLSLTILKSKKILIYLNQSNDSE